MEFSLDHLRTGLRPGSSRFKPGRRPVPIWSKPNSIMLSWSQTGPRLVADLLAGATSLQVIGQIPARCRSATCSLGPVCDQDSVMVFSFYRMPLPWSNIVGPIPVDLSNCLMNRVIGIVTHFRKRVHIAVTWVAYGSNFVLINFWDGSGERTPGNKIEFCCER